MGQPSEVRGESITTRLQMEFKESGTQEVGERSGLELRILLYIVHYLVCQPLFAYFIAPFDLRRNDLFLLGDIN